MFSGRADCSGDWLPARIRPVRGESFDSLCRRLVAANGITPTGLLRGGACPSTQAPILLWRRLPIASEVAASMGGSWGTSKGSDSRVGSPP
jgi:hypothetical protein